MDIIKPIPYFLTGGTIITIIHIVTNIHNNTAMAACLTLFPLSIFGAYAIKSHKHLTQYTYSLMRVILITLICLLFLFLSLKINLHPYIFISLSLILWFILQYYNYYYTP